MFERELVCGSGRCTAQDCRVEVGLQLRPPALRARLHDADGVSAIVGGERLWKRRAVEKSNTRLFHRAWKSRKHRGIPTFPQPRPRRASTESCYARNPKP